MNRIIDVVCINDCNTVPRLRSSGRRRAAVFAMLATMLGACGQKVQVVGPVVELQSPSAPSSMAPRLAVTPAGAAVMSWLEALGDGSHALKFSVLGTAGWSEPRLVARGSNWFVNWADFPSVTPITATDWVAHWLVRRPDGPTYAYDVAIAISRDAGATWGAALTPHDDGTPTEHGFVSLFPWGEGFGAVWLDGRRTARKTEGTVTGMTVRYARIGFDGKIREGGEIDELSCDCCATDVAVTAAGPITTYRNRTAEEIRDIVVSRFGDGAWQPPLIVGDDRWKVAGCPVNGSTIAALGENVAVAWYTAAEKRPRVQLAWSTDGGRTFSAPSVLAEGAVGGRVGIALLADELAAVTWTTKAQGDGKGQIMMRLVSRRGAPSEERVIAEEDVSRAGGFPQMVSVADGLVYAWTVPGAQSGIVTAQARLE